MYLGDSIVWRARRNRDTVIKVTRTGLITIWARTETKFELPIEFEHGKEYYIKCSTVTGILEGRPFLTLMDPYTGKIEYNNMRKK